MDVGLVLREHTDNPCFAPTYMPLIPGARERISKHDNCQGTDRDMVYLHRNPQMRYHRGSASTNV